MPKIPRTKEWLARYKTSFVEVMEPREAFTSKVMRQPNVGTRLPMKAKPLHVEQKEWGDSAIKVTFINLQGRE